MSIKAIETEYKGCRFRSRLEARWAVFFNALALRWHYEPEGYQIEHEGEIIRYLPDFKVESIGVVEVKGPPLKDMDKFKIEAFVGQSKESITVLSNIPSQDNPDKHKHLNCTYDENLKTVRWGTIDLREMTQQTPYALTAAISLAVDSALNTARSARFEHGEKG